MSYLFPNQREKWLTKGPKPSKGRKAAFITSYPYKDALLAAGEKRKKSDSAEVKRKLKDKKKKDDQLPTKKTQTETRQAVKRKFLNDSHEESCESGIDSGESVLETLIVVENPSDEEAVCLFCEGLLLADNRGGLWV